ncbi:hypothetical protein R3W88_007920 [Solanum pinnatisectum]|uniref:HMG box domain-containing protein n=1 Tax=Solanum pinnatisectum TaxID=50273 RepID=A0AAV9M720_9SOLN|nr:hypothetical protein R3W88_007920 [Solanum pinnatisectum]
MQLAESYYNLKDGNSLVGTIDAKFDYGYVIFVNLGSESLNGVLYHTPALPNQFQKVNTLAMPSQRIRKRQLALKDPSRPKPNRSGYNFFFDEHYAMLKPSYQGKERAISKRIGLLWSRLTEAEKQVVYNVLTD